jgi:hypothetical protein
VLAFLMNETYEVSHGDGLIWHHVHMRFHDDRLRRSNNINSITRTFRGYSIAVLLMRGIYSVRR